MTEVELVADLFGGLDGLILHGPVGPRLLTRPPRLTAADGPPRVAARGDLTTGPVEQRLRVVTAVIGHARVHRTEPQVRGDERSRIAVAVRQDVNHRDRGDRIDQGLGTR